MSNGVDVYVRRLLIIILGEVRNLRERVEMISDQLTLISQKEDAIMAMEDDILSGIQDLDSTEDGVIQLLTNIKQALDSAGSDQAKLAEVKATIARMKDKAAAAVVANTPADTGGGGGGPPAA